MENRTQDMKRDRKYQFEKLANSRVNKTINCIRLIGNLSEKSNYEYTGDQVEKIYNTLTAALDKMKSRFENGGETDTGFKLDKEATYD